MIKFTQAQKNELDALKQAKTGSSSFEAIYEVQRHEADYPVLYLYLFNSDNGCANQDNFSKVWLGVEDVSVQVDKYYLVIFGQYVSLDPDKQVVFTAKDDFSKAYQKMFTDFEIDDLQDNPKFKGFIDLGACKVLVTDEIEPKVVAAVGTATVDDAILG